MVLRSHILTAFCLPSRIGGEKVILLSASAWGSITAVTPLLAQLSSAHLAFMTFSRILMGLLQGKGHSGASLTLSGTRWGDKGSVHGCVCRCTRACRWCTSVCVWVCLRACVHQCVRVCKCICPCRHVCASSMHVCVCLCLCVHMCACTRVSVHVCVQVVCMPICVCTCVSVPVCRCMCGHACAFCKCTLCSDTQGHRGHLRSELAPAPEFCYQTP